MSLTTCIAKATAIDPADKAWLIDRARVLRGEGVSTEEAARQAVSERLAEVRGLLDAATPTVSANTVFTEDAAAKAREILRKKLGGQLNSGLDPEVLQAGLTLAGYHIERGARTFSAFAKAMLEDMGDMVRPYLKSWYMAAKYDPRMVDVPGLSSAAEVESADVPTALPAGWSESTPGGMAANADPKTGGIVDTEIKSGQWFVVSNDDRIGTLDGFETRADALKALKRAHNGVLDASSTNSDLERDRGDAGTASPAVEGSVPPLAHGAGPGADPDRIGPGSQGLRPADDPGVPPGGTTAVGEPSDQQLHRDERSDGPSEFDAGTDVDQRGFEFGGAGVQSEALADDAAEEATRRAVDDAAKRRAQREAESIAIKHGDLDNIRATLPYLLPEQQEDVHKAETRFAKPDGYGMLYTNGTGTGKTFTGLGMVKRLARQGKTEQLVIVPDGKILADWVDSAKAMGLTITPLEDTKDAGRGITITTYANAGENDALARRKWDLVTADEAHQLLQGKDGEATKTLDTLRALTYHPRGAWKRLEMLHRKEHDEMQALAKVKEPTARQKERQRELNVLNQKWRDELSVEFKAMQGAKRPRAAFLSATPFAYEKTVDWAEGYLFDYTDGYPYKGETLSYNQPSPHDYFFMTHFGYSMRVNKLTKPDAKVDSGQLQRQFNGWLKKNGSLSGRMLDVPHDYDRKFVLVDSAVGNQIDAALQFVSDKASEESQSNYKRDAKEDPSQGWTLLNAALRKELYGEQGHLVRRYLLEAIKAKEVVQHIRDHLKLGRKIVVFHDFKKGGSRNPFALPQRTTDGLDPDQAKLVTQYNLALSEFNGKFPAVTGNALLSDLISPIQRFRKEFPNVLVINGDEKPADNLARYKRFNDDGTGPIVALVQSDKNKGWSGHDTTGQHQRVLFNLGLPTKPTMSIQQEGRIYRIGQVSDAMFRYLNTGTNWERWAFAQTIARRAAEAENLGAGEFARALLDSFVTAFEESDAHRAGEAGEGKGGKERDRALNDITTEFDRAKGFYWGTQKKNSRTKAEEGADYFATPEPVGLKMVEWADIRGGEDVLEPSAGHGAIARWFPETTNRTAIEPSMALRSRMALVFDGKIVDGLFEGLHVNNKYDAIVMNPPFGTAGRMAVDHLARAATHLRDGGRIVALIPAGPSADAKFEKWFYEEDTRPIKPLMEHPTLGPIYRGDTVRTKADWAPEGKVASRAMTGDTVMLSVEGTNGNIGVHPNAFTEIVSRGKRTESFKPAEGLQLVADIKLPSVTFERAATNAMTRIVVLEKSDNAPQQVNRDFSNAKDINELFDRIEDSGIAPRAKPIEEVQLTAKEQRETAKAEKANAKAEGAKLAEAQSAAVVEHTTAKGKLLKGVIRTDLTRDQAKEVDAFTFPKNGGMFIRLEHLAKLNEKYPPKELPKARVDDQAGAPDNPTREQPASPNDQRAVELLQSNLTGVVPGVELDALPAGTPAAPGQSGPGSARPGLTAVAKALWGHDVVWFGANRRFASGLMDPEQPGKVFLNVESQQPHMAVLMHEMLHSLRREHPGIYNQLRARILAVSDDLEPRHQQLLESFKKAGWKNLPNKDGLEEEFLGDVSGDMGMDPEFWKLLAKGQPAGFKRVIDTMLTWLDKVIAKLLSLGHDQAPFNTRAYVNDWKQARSAVAEAFRQFSNAENEIRDINEGKPMPSVDGAPEFRSDIPDEAWLRSKIDYAKERGRTRWGAPYFGTVTGRFRGGDPVAPVAALSKLKGLRGEQDNVRERDLASLVKVMGDTGKLPLVNGQEHRPFIMVAYNGEAWVNEGNHRIMAASKLGWDTMPVEVRYFDGGERVAKGAFSPAALGAKPSNVLASVDRHTPEQRDALARAGMPGKRNAGYAIREAFGTATGLLASRNEVAAQFRQGFLDQFYGIRRNIQNEIGNLPAEQDPYITARLANGGASSVMRALMLHGQAKWTANGQHLEKIPGTEGLLDILKPLGEDLNDFFGWMIGNRAARLKREGRENNLTDDQIAALRSLNHGKEQLFTDTAAKYAAFKRSVLDVAEQAGLIDASARKVWDNADYIPFYRQIDEKALFSATGRKGLAGQSSGIRTLKGGENSLNDPMENLLMNFSRLIDASLKNNAIRKTIAHLGETDVLTKVGYDMKSQIVPAAQVKKLLQEAGTDEAVLDAIPEEAFEGMAKMWAIQAPSDPQVIRVMVNGKPVFYRVNEPTLLKALTSFVPFDFPGLKAARYFKRLLTGAVTATPTFMVRNWIRDTAASQLTARDGFSPHKSLAGMVKSYTETGAAEAMLFAGASFQSGHINAADPQGSAVAMRRALRQRGMDASSIDSFIGSVTDSTARLWEHYRQIGEAIENANREAVFEAAIKAGKSVGEAAFEAKDLLDFNLRGSSPAYQLAADTIPFFNARVQGLYRAAQNNPDKLATGLAVALGKRFLAYGLTMAAASAALAFANSGEPWYEELPDWDKDNFWHFMIRGVHLRIPKPFELGVVFATIPERITRYVMGYDKGNKAASTIWKNVADQLKVFGQGSGPMPWLPSPQIFTPAINAATNYDPFRERPIESMGDEAKLPHLRYSSQTSDTFRVLTRESAQMADELGLSPKKLEYLVGGYFGSVGLAALGLSDMVVRRLEGKPPGPTTRPDDMPFIGSFYRQEPPHTTVYESDLYKMRTEVQKIFRSVKALETEHDYAAAETLRKQEATKLQAGVVIERAADDMRKLRKLRDQVQASAVKTPDQKRKELDEIQTKINAAARQAMTQPMVRAAQ